MKHIFRSSWIVLLYMHSIYSYSQLQENFSDGDYTRNPQWIFSDSSDWMINNNRQLQSKGMLPNTTSWISTSNSLADSVQWEMDIHLLFNPSSLNYLDIYLISSDSIPLSNTSAGYFIRLGNTDDEISLYRKDSGNKIFKIIDGINGLLNKSENHYRIKITRREKAKWSLWYDATMKGTQYVDGGKATDATYQESKYFSFFIQQSTASFFQKHFIDNISISYFVPDTTPPFLMNCSIINPVTIQLQFNEAVHPASVEDLNNYFINNGVDQPVHITKDSISFNVYNIILGRQMFSGEAYQLLIKNISDLFENKMKDTLIPILFYTPQRGDIIINEILFNPKGSGSDYIEIMNRSTYPINMKGFSLTNIGLSGSSTNIKTLFSYDYDLSPGEYIVFTDDKVNILSSFRVLQKEKVFTITSIPSLPNENGNLRLIGKDGSIIDELYYDESWHFPLLNQREGVALERIYTNGQTQDPENWNSASKTSGYGTPTASNSQNLIAKGKIADISLTSGIFSPDQDGIDDMLFIQYTFQEGGYLLNCNIFDMIGRPVRTLQRNMLCGISGSFKWDGLDEQSRELPMGHYIVFTEIFNLKGDVKTFKNEVILARRR